MGESLCTTIAPFSSSGGRAQGRAANVRAVEPAADLPGADRGNLYILIEVTGSGGGHAALYRQMLNAAQSAFYEASGGLSAGLVRAVRNAHWVLAHANEALPEASWRAGISCVAFQGNELMIAQAGPALIMVSHPKTIDQYPAQAGSASVALGGSERPEVELYRTAVEPGSTILIAQSDWLKLVSPESLAAVTAAADPRLAADYLAQLAGEADLSALLVGFDSALPEVQEQDSSVAAQTSVPRPSATQPASTPVREQAAPSPKPRAVVVPAVTEEPDEGSLSHPVSKPARERPAAPRRVKTEAGSTEEDSSRRSPWGLVLALVVIPLIVIVLVLAMLWFRTRNAEAQFQQTLTGAETAITDAQLQQDEPTARLRLGNARDFLEKARVLRPNDPQLAKVQASYSEVLARINHITPLYGLMSLVQFKETGRKPARILVGGDSLFVLDLGKSEILRFTLSKLGDSANPATPAVILRKGQPVGTAAVSDLLDADWAVAVGNQRSRLFALDTAGGLVSYDLTWAATRIPIVGREKWVLPQLIKAYGGNLYVIDAKGSQIWRYRPSEKGFENQPEPYFTPTTNVDLSGVQSIDIDGNVWLLFADGRLLKFFGGEQKAFELKGLPDPLSAPTAIAAQLDGDLIYVADAGNGRILEFTKEGQFQRQFRPPEGNALQDMRDLFLDEAGDKFYIVTPDSIYKADLPKMPPASSAAPGQ